MSIRTALVLAFAAVLAPSFASAGSTGSADLAFSITVPLVCNLEHDRDADPDGSVRGIPLGQVSELCNSTSGYRVIVDYSPGTLVGAKLRIGGEQVELNGSGEAVLVNSPYPGRRTRALAIDPGPRGIDASAFSLRIVAN